MITKTAAALAYVAWWAALALLSYGLVSTEPPKVSAAVLPPAYSFAASKTLHLVSYLALGAGAALLAVGAWHRRALLLTLAAHAVSTEWLQTFVEGRTGSPRDVCINLAGLTLGLLLVRSLGLTRARAGRAGRALSATTTAT